MPQIPAGWYHDPAPQPREVRRCCGIGMAGCGLNTWRRYTPGYSLGGSRSALGTPSGNGTCGTGSSRIWPCSSSSTCADALPS